jgi:cation transport ATPase
MAGRVMLLSSNRLTYQSPPTAYPGRWRVRSVDCRGQPLLDKLDSLHHCQMDTVQASHEKLTLAESAQPGLQPVVITAVLVVLLHTVMMPVHGAAHMRLKVELSTWANIYVLCVVGIGPIVGLFLLRSSRRRTGATILFVTMIGALLFGFWNHFIAHGPDHVMHLEAGPWRLPFQVTAVLLAMSELAGAIVAFMLLRVLSRQTKARIRMRKY